MPILLGAVLLGLLSILLVARNARASYRFRRLEKRILLVRAGTADARECLRELANAALELRSALDAGRSTKARIQADRIEALRADLAVLLESVSHAAGAKAERAPGLDIVRADAVFVPCSRRAVRACADAGVELQGTFEGPPGESARVELDAARARRLASHLVDIALEPGSGGALALSLAVVPSEASRATLILEAARRPALGRANGPSLSRELAGDLAKTLGGSLEIREHEGSIVARALVPARLLLPLEEPRDPDDLGGGRALVVEDDRDARSALSLLLEDWGFEVVEAACGVEAVDAVAAGGARVALLDIDLPDHDGFALRELLRSRSPELPVVFLSGSEEHIARGGDDPRARYLLKPVDLQALEDALRALLFAEADVAPVVET